MKQRKEDDKERFKEILLATGRPDIDYVIEQLEKMGFFEMPASVANHLNSEGGLVKHSLNVYDEAMGLREVQSRLCPGIERSMPDESVAIAALLHDVCKTDQYRKVGRQKRDKLGDWTKYSTFDVDGNAFPCGHGEKSVIMLLQWGLDLTDDELLAIRWHMGPWALPFQSQEAMRQYNTSRKKYPLVMLIEAADNLAAGLIED